MSVANISALAESPGTASLDLRCSSRSSIVLGADSKVTMEQRRPMAMTQDLDLSFACCSSPPWTERPVHRIEHRRESPAANASLWAGCSVRYYQVPRSLPES